MNNKNDDLEAWLRLMNEEPLDPGLRICDSHMHLWDGPRDRGRYLLDEYLSDAYSGHNIVSTVFIECGAMYRKEGPQEIRPVGETDFAQSVAAESATGQHGQTLVAAGIVAFADLTLGADVVPVLEAHIEAGRGSLRGIRQICSWDSDPEVISMGKAEGMMLDRKFREGFAFLQRYGLSFDAWQYYTQLEEVADIARKFSDTNIIVNHTGGPLGIGGHAGKRKDVFDRWKRSVVELSSLPNVFMKLGGLGMPRCGFGWHEMAKPPGSIELAEVMAPYYSFCIELFGVDRCMFESNFPVDKVSYPYKVLWNMFKRISKDYSIEERNALFHDTAVKVYHLEENKKY